MPRLWWDVPFDDHLTARFPGCMLCGAVQLAWLWARVVHGVPVSIRLCLRCRRQDPQHQRVEALLAERYAPGRWA